MLLTSAQIVEAGERGIDAAKIVAKIVEDAMAKINAHNATKGAAQVNAGPLSVALGYSTTVVEQLEKHVRENTPAPAVAPPAPANPQPLSLNP